MFKKIIVAQIVCFGIFLSGCSTSKADKKDNSPATTNGSCLTNDPTKTGAQSCYEVTEKDSTFKDICSASKGQWSKGACDASKFARKCQQTGTVSVDNGPQTTSHETYYFAAGSTVGCAGQEQLLNSASPTPTPAAPAPTLEPGTSTVIKTGNNLVDQYGSVYCTVTLKSDETDMYSDVVLKGGSSYLLTRYSKFSANVLVSNSSNQLVDASIEPSNIATSTCGDLEKLPSSIEIFLLDTPVYNAASPSDLQAKCTIRAGTILPDDGYNVLRTNMTAVFDFPALATWCAGITKGRSANNLFPLYPRR